MNRDESRKFDLLAVLLILCIFSVTVLSLLLTGAKTYRSITQRGQTSQKSQIDALYISNKIFQAESAEAVSIRTEDGVQVLLIESEEGGEPHVTRVYCYKGWIMELYSDADYHFLAGDGEKITQADSLEFVLKDGLLSAEIRSGENVTRQYYDLEEGRR